MQISFTSQLSLIHTVYIISGQKKKMRKAVKQGESEQEFSNFLKNVIEVQHLYLENCKSMNKKIESPSVKDKNAKISQLQKQSEQHVRKIVIINAQLSCFKEKTRLLLKKCQAYQQILANIMGTIKQYTVQNESNEYQHDSTLSFDDLDISSLKIRQQYITQGLKTILHSLSNPKQPIPTIPPNKQLENKLKQIEQENKKILAMNMIYSKQIQKYKQHCQKLQKHIISVTDKLKLYEQEELQCSKLMRDLDFKTKNRAEIILLFKGVVKKQRLHQGKCGLYRGQEQVLTAAELEQYERERKQQHAESKRQLTNVLNLI